MAACRVLCVSRTVFSWDRLSMCLLCRVAWDSRKIFWRPAESSHAGGQTDGRDKANSSFFAILRKRLLTLIWKMLKIVWQSDPNLLFSLSKTHANSWCCLTKYHGLTSRPTPLCSTAISLRSGSYCNPVLLLLCRPAFLLLIRMPLFANVTFWSSHLFVRVGSCNHFTL